MEGSKSKTTGKKRRKLEKYIEKKLKQEERSNLLQRLAQSQTTTNTSKLRPSASLGSRQLLSNEEQLTKSARHETNPAFKSHKRKRNLEQASIDSSEEDWTDEVVNEDKLGDKTQLNFKEWARKQLLVSKKLDLKQAKPPEGEEGASPLTKETYRPSIKDTRAAQSTGIVGPLGEVFSMPSSSLLDSVRGSSTIKTVTVRRDDNIQAGRLLLPIISEEQTIMETILFNPIVIICGETGSGKTTQIPQFLYEAGFGTQGSENPGMIGITQPRRVAAMSMANRVGIELGLSSSRVAYQIRYDATVSPSTVIKFMTDGVLLRELTTDFLLTKYSVIIIDEAHERSLNTDILIGALSRIVKLRQTMWTEKKEGVKPLRLIIMSATLRVEDFTTNPTLFSTPPPVINIPTRQHPVTIHFSRRTMTDYVSGAVRKVSQIHTKLPAGGILVFLTGQNEIIGVCRKLKAKYNKPTKNKPSEKSKAEADVESAGTSLSAIQADVEPEEIELGDQGLDADADTDLEEPPDNASDSEDSASSPNDEMPMHVVPLYSLLSNEKQLEVFKEPPPGSRLVVVATNIAETSLTIPNIRYVVDCGRVKERKYDSRSNIQTFPVTWISKAAAAQRSGRAGRTGPGHCYRLYSSALYENYFDEFSKPEILRVPIEGVVLQMKAINIDAVVNFPFPTPPDRVNLKKAEETLVTLGALEDKEGTTFITNLGKAMAIFPLSPRFSRVLVSAKQNGCLPFSIVIVSALASGDPFLRPEHLSDSGNGERLDGDGAGEKQSRLPAFYASQQLHGSLGGGVSDVFRLLSVVGAYEFAGGGLAFCAEQFVRPKVMEEIHKLQSQLLKIIRTNFPEISTGLSLLTNPPNSTQLKILRQLLAAAFVDQVAVRKDIIDQSSSANGNKYTSCRNVPYKALGVSEDTFIHPSSVLYNSPPPDFIVFHEMVRTTQVWLKMNTVINPSWLPKLAPSLCTSSKRVKAFGGGFLIIHRFGPDLWELPAIRESENK